MTDLIPDEDQSPPGIREWFLTVSQGLLDKCERAQYGPVWDYEVEIEEWLREVYDASSIPLHRRNDLVEELKDIFRDTDVEDFHRFSAYYCLAMHMVIAGHFNSHETLIGEYNLWFGDHTQSFPYQLLEHRRAMVALHHTWQGQDKRETLTRALRLSMTCLETYGLDSIPGVANVHATIVTLMIESSVLKVPPKSVTDAMQTPDEVNVALNYLNTSIDTLIHEDRLHDFAQILVTRALLKALCEQFDEAREDIARAKSLDYRARPEDELSVSKVELLALNAQLIDQRSAQIVETFQDTIDDAMQRSRGETLQLIGLIGAIIAFVSVGATISLNVSDPSIIGHLFLLMGGVILTTFGSLWVMIQSSRDQRKLYSGQFFLRHSTIILGLVAIVVALVLL
ncbi:MAG: hypothetical protein OXF99_00285 [bacterium]|nr:hypothetical protein [bacterium]